MTTQALHPRQLGPGDVVGAWRILEVAGGGGFGRVFKVERNGLVGAMKMALQPASAPVLPEEEDADRRMAYEVAALLLHHTHSNLVRVLAMDRWPDLEGYRYVVTEYVEGDTFHAWRWREGPTLARFVDVFSELVRALGELHRLGVFHRDLKPSNVLVRRSDGRPFLIDFGVVRLPGTSALTKGLPPGAFHLLPPRPSPSCAEEATSAARASRAACPRTSTRWGCCSTSPWWTSTPSTPSCRTRSCCAPSRTWSPRLRMSSTPGCPRP